MRTRLNLEHLDTFRDVVEQGSFSGAAQRANLSQPAVSLQIRQLERRLGVTLLERVGRKATATAAGTELLGHAGLIGAAVSDMLDAMARHATGTSGRIRLGTGATACIFLLPPILRELRQRLPDLEITVSTGNTVDIVRAVEENRLDIGLVTMPAAGRMLQVTPIVDDEFVVVAPQNMPLPARVTPAVLAQLPVLLFEPGGNTRRIADQWFAKAGASLKPVMSLGSVEAIKELAAAGLGCAILPMMAVRSMRTPMKVRSLSPRLHRQLALGIRHDKPLNRGLRALIAGVRKAAGKSAHL